MRALPAAVGLLALAAVALAPAPARAQQTHLVVIVGVGGDAEHRDRFHEWAVTLVDAAGGPLAIAPERVHYLGERVERDPDRIDARSTREAIESTLAGVAGSAGANDTVAIVLIGHGTSGRDGAKFNVPGRDPTAADFAVMLDAFTSQRVVFVNTATASGEFVAALSGPRRTIVTATKTGRERNDTVFGGYFVQALAAEAGADPDTDADADLDKDGRVSVLEAYTFARRQVAQAYENDGLLLTEHALLDDNGDGEGSHEPDPDQADGAVARMVFLAPRPGAVAAAAVDAAASPELSALYDERLALEERIDALRAARDGLDPAEYQRELETLMIELARTSRAIRDLEGRSP